MFGIQSVIRNCGILFVLVGSLIVSDVSGRNGEHLSKMQIFAFRELGLPHVFNRPKSQKVEDVTAELSSVLMCKELETVTTGVPPTAIKYEENVDLSSRAGVITPIMCKENQVLSGDKCEEISEQ